MIKALKNIVSKNRKKVGFTLVEVLAVIVILGIIIAIFVTVSQKVLDFSYEKAHNVNLESLENAGKEYIVRNNLKLENQEVYIITMDELKSTGVIEDIIDPETKLVCEGYVLDKKVDSIEIVEPYLKCEGGYTTPGYGDADSISPDITILGDNPATVLLGTEYTDAGAMANDNYDGDLSSKIIVESNVNINAFGTYSVTYSVKDKLLNEGTATRTVYVTEEGFPTVEFSMNGNSNYAKSRSTIVTVSDEDSGVNASQLKYEWTTTTDAPEEGTFYSNFTNGMAINTPVGATGDYYLWILAKDNAGNTTIVRTDVFKLDNTIPVITILGDNPKYVSSGTTYSDAGATASDNIDGNITGNISATSTVNTNLAGTYTVKYNVTDSVGNVASEAIRTVVVLDAISPTVSFGMNGNATYAKSRSTSVTVSDPDGGIDTSSLKYLWNTSTTAPTEGSFSTTFTNGATISSPAGVSGGYYLWILAKDTSNNKTITRTNVFKLDNVKPVLTILGNNPTTIGSGLTYYDSGATASDNEEGNISGWISVSSNVNTNATGNYTVTYNVSDTAGNTATAVSRTVIVLVRNVEILIVGGGAGGGRRTDDKSAGGGGAGGLVETTITLGVQSYGVTVGGGGAGAGCDNCAGSYGGNSTFAGYTALAGGPGQGGGTGGGYPGGSGGGGKNDNAPGGASTQYSTYGYGYGNRGGTGSNANDSKSGGGGGGGAAGVGGQGGLERGGCGGTGWASSITGTTKYYAGGGGGGGKLLCEGGSGVGGQGGYDPSRNGKDAVANTGSGGGGGHQANNGGSGSAGIVIIRYLGSQKASGGSVTSWNGYTIHTFTGSGTFTVSSS